MRQSLRYLLEQDEEGSFKEPAPENNLMFKNVETKSRKSLDSLDNQIDALILGYEKSAIRDKDEATAIKESLSNLSLAALLLEQDEEVEDVVEDEVDVDVVEDVLLQFLVHFLALARLLVREV